MKKLLISFCIFAICSQCFSQSNIVLEGNLTVKDDPSTTSSTEGNLNILGGVTINGFTNILGYSAQINIGNYNVFESADGANIGGLIVGVNNTLSHQGGFSFIMGATNTISQANSFAVGINNNITCPHSFALGEGNNALSNVSFALGRENFTQAYFTFALGRGLKANTVNEVVVGRWNACSDIRANPWDFVESDNIFVVGNGSSDTNRSNALEVKKSGDTNINGKLKVKSIEITEPSSEIPMGEFGRAE